MSVQKLRLLIVFVSIILVVSIPVSAEDSDGDGVSDAYDLCPQTPTGETVDSDGCSSSQKDTDGDGVSDANDAFPNDSGRSSDDLGSQVEYVFTGDAPHYTIYWNSIECMCINSNCDSPPSGNCKRDVLG
jgi:hypothetical protein